MDQARKTLGAAITAAQQAVKPAPKEGNNARFSYRYATAEAILETARAALHAHGLAVVPLSTRLTHHTVRLLTPEWEDAKTGAIVPPREVSHEQYHLERVFRLYHVSGELVDLSFDWPVVPEKGRPADKATASADTTSLAYFLRDLLAMPRATDTDDMDHSSRSLRPAVARPRVASVPPRESQAARPAPRTVPAGSREMLDRRRAGPVDPDGVFGNEEVVDEETGEVAEVRPGDVEAPRGGLVEAAREEQERLARATAGAARYFENRDGKEPGNVDGVPEEGVLSAEERARFEKSTGRKLESEVVKVPRTDRKPTGPAAVLTVEAVRARLGAGTDGLAAKVLAAPLDAASDPALCSEALRALASVYGEKRIREERVKVGGLTVNKALVPLTGGQLRALVSVLEPVLVLAPAEKEGAPAPGKADSGSAPAAGSTTTGAGSTPPASPSSSAAPAAGAPTAPAETRSSAEAVGTLPPAAGDGAL